MSGSALTLILTNPLEVVFPLSAVLGSEPRALTLDKHASTELQIPSFFVDGFWGRFFIGAVWFACLFVFESVTCSPDWPGIQRSSCSFKMQDSQVLRSKACTITPARIARSILTILETRHRQGPHP